MKSETKITTADDMKQEQPFSLMLTTILLGYPVLRLCTGSHEQGISILPTRLQCRFLSFARFSVVARILDWSYSETWPRSRANKGYRPAARCLKQLLRGMNHRSYCVRSKQGDLARRGKAAKEHKFPCLIDHWPEYLAFFAARVWSSPCHWAEE